MQYFKKVLNSKGLIIRKIEGNTKMCKYENIKRGTRGSKMAARTLKTIPHWETFIKLIHEIWWKCLNF